MHSPLWMLVPWAVFAVAAGCQFWRLTGSFRRRLAQPMGETEFRHSLERIWRRQSMQ